MKRKSSKIPKEKEMEANDDEVMDDEEIEEPKEWHDHPETSVIQNDNNDYQKEFKVLGQQDFHTLSKINVTSSWVENATTFPSEIIDENLAILSSIKGIPEKLFKKVKTEIKHWFPVQKSVIPILLENIISPPILRPRDITISAPTGSGKTLCYILPSLVLVGEVPAGILSVLILAPVQTLVTQIEKEFSRFNVYNARIIALSGAEDFEKEVNKLTNSKIDIIISTPGRFMEHLMGPENTIKLDWLSFLVIDEADNMGLKARMEWLDVIERRTGISRAINLGDILNTRSAPRKLLLSATLSKNIDELHMWNLHRPCLFRANATSSEKLISDGCDHITGALALPSQIIHKIYESEKPLHPLIIHQELSNATWARVLIFVNEKDSAQRLSILLTELSKGSYSVANLTADLYGHRRVKVLKKFKSGATRILICSDVLARGVDIEDVECVINYNLPLNDRLFVHRAGRTARAGKEGHLLSLADKDDKRRFEMMLKKTNLWKKPIEISVSKEDLENYMNDYRAALKELENKFTKSSDKKGTKGKNRKVSGFEHNKKRKWIPGLKEQREAEKLAKRGIRKKPEKQDY